MSTSKHRRFGGSPGNGPRGRLGVLSLVAGAVLLVGAGLPKALEAKRLTTFNLIAPVGQVLGGVLLGVAAAAGGSFVQGFWLAAIVMFLAFLITWALTVFQQRSAMR